VRTPCRARIPPQRSPGRGCEKIEPGGQYVRKPVLGFSHILQVLVRFFHSLGVHERDRRWVLRLDSGRRRPLQRTSARRDRGSSVSPRWRV
jgi:hypothetical protein